MDHIHNLALKHLKENNAIEQFK